MSYLSLKELKNIGFYQVGDNVKISSKASIYEVERISLGSNIRIDDFCVLSGNISIGNNVHLSTHVSLTATIEPLLVDEGSTISYGSKLFTASDDFGGDYMFNPTYSLSERNVIHRSITIEKFVAIGALCTIMPGSHIGTGAVVGAMSLVKGNLNPWTIYVGTPVRVLQERKRGLLDFQ